MVPWHTPCPHKLHMVLIMPELHRLLTYMVSKNDGVSYTQVRDQVQKHAAGTRGIRYHNVMKADKQGCNELLVK